MPADGRRRVSSLESDLLGGAPILTRREVEERAGASGAFSERLWQAMGFVPAGQDERRFAEADADALRTLGGLVTSGALDEDTAVALTRTAGSAMARIADACATAVAEAGADPDVAQRFLDVRPDVERLLVHVWRRHLLAAVLRGIDSGAWRSTQDMSVGFADMVGFSTLARTVDSTSLVRIAERFDAEGRDRVVRLGGRVVKTIGDEVLFVSDDAASAAEIAVSLLGVEGLDALPPVRVGLGYGPVVMRQGDVYGEIVNIASRLTALARPGTALADRGFAAQLAGDDRWSVRALRPTRVRGYGHLVAHVLRPSG